MKWPPFWYSVFPFLPLFALSSTQHQLWSRDSSHSSNQCSNDIRFHSKWKLKYLIYRLTKFKQLSLLLSLWQNLLVSSPCSPQRTTPYPCYSSLNTSYLKDFSFNFPSAWYMFIPRYSYGWLNHNLLILAKWGHSWPGTQITTSIFPSPTFVSNALMIIKSVLLIDLGGRDLEYFVHCYFSSTKCTLTKNQLDEWIKETLIKKNTYSRIRLQCSRVQLIAYKLHGPGQVIWLSCVPISVLDTWTWQ